MIGGPSFILIRHAESPWSPDDTRPLSLAGARAAALLPERLAGVPIDAIYSSPYRRALQTVLPLAERRGLAVTEIDELRERAFGTFERQSFDEAMAASWLDFDLAYSGGESSRVAQARVLAVVGTLAHRHTAQTVALGTHGNLLALLLHAFDPSLGVDFWKSLTFPDVFELRWLGPGAGVFRRI